jgi:hypothetical protein
MLLGSRFFGTSDIRRLVVNYEDWLSQGFTLVSVTANISPTTGITSTVGAVTLDPDKKKAFIFLNCGTVVNESFTLNIVGTDNFGQTVNDQLLVTIMSPGAT